MASTERTGGIALIAGTLMSFVTMLLHPTGQELLADVEGVSSAVIIAHTIAIAGIPVSLFGALAIRRRLAGVRDLADAGLILFGMSLVAVLIAAVASGFLAPMTAKRLARATPEELEAAKALFRYGGMINHAFAAVYVASLGAAMAVWSWGMRRIGSFGKGLPTLGLLVGLTLLGITFAGRLRLDVHHFGMIVIAQGIWMLWAGRRLIADTVE